MTLISTAQPVVFFVLNDVLCYVQTVLSRFLNTLGQSVLVFAGVLY